MAEVADEQTDRSRNDGERPAGSASHETPGCPVAWCPICLAVTTVQPLKPEVVEHLLKAGTEMLLAFRGVIDARADEVRPPDGDRDRTRLEKIDIG